MWAQGWSLRFRSLRLEPLEDRTLLSLTPAGPGDTADGAALLATSDMAATSTAGGANLALIEDGLPGFLASLQDELNEVVFTAPAPLVGNQLSIEPPGQFMDDVAANLESSWLVANPGIQDVKDALNTTLGTLVRGSISHVGNNSSDEIQFQMTLVSGEIHDLLDVDLALGVDPMIDPRLGIENQVDVTAEWTFELTFGVSKTDGFFVRTAAADELTVEVTATLPDSFAAKGIVGVFGALIEADGASTFSSSYAIDLVDAGGDGTLLAANYAELLVDATLTGSGTVNLDVDASFIPDFVADADRKALFNLVVTADASITYTFDHAGTQPKGQAGEEPEGKFGEPVIVAFENVTLNLGKFFTEFVDPTIRKIQETLEPLKPVVDFLTDPVPVISDLSGDDVTVLDLAATVAASTGQGELADGIEKAKTIVTFIDGFLDLPVPFTPNLDAEYEETNIGKFKVEVEPPEWPEYLPAYEDDTKDPRPKKQRDEELERDRAYQDARNGLLSAGEGEGEFFTKFGAQLQFPFLKDPTIVSAMLMGETDVDLVTFGIGFDFGFKFEYSYPVIPGLLNADLGFGFDAALQLGAGYDMFGVAALTHSLDFSSETNLELSVDDNLYRLADGFYFDDHNDQQAADGEIDATNPNNPAKDAPELTLSATMTAGASLGPKLGPFKAVVGVSLNFGTHIFFDLNDLPEPQNDAQFDYVHELLNQHTTEVPEKPYSYDGRVRIGEMQLIVQADPAGIFNYSGALTVGMDVYVKVTLKIGWFQCTLIDETWNLFNKVIYDFNIYQLEDEKVLAGQRLNAPVVGTVDGNGTLKLYMGADAGQRRHTGPDRTNEPSPETRESFFVTSQGLTDSNNPAGGETLEVTFQAWDPQSGQWVARGKQIFKNVKKIEASGGAGDDRILVDDTVAARVDFEGGGGNDELSYAGSGVAELHGDAGNDKLLGGSGDDWLYGGSDDDELLGGPGMDHLYGGDGADRLDGQAGDDTLEGGMGDDTYVWRLGTGIDVFAESGGSDHISIRGATQVTQTDVRDGVPGVTELDDVVELIGNGVVTVQTSGGTIEVDDIESIGVAAGGGADRIVLHNLGHTEVERLSVDLSSPDEADEADGDTVIVTGRETATGNENEDNDEIVVWGGVDEEGVGGKDVVRIRHTTGTTTCEAVILNSDPARDRLYLQGSVGNDTLTVSSGEDGVRAQDLVTLRLDGGAGDDVLSTVYSDVEIVGGAGDDELIVLDDIYSSQTAYIDLANKNVAVYLGQRAPAPDHLISFSGVEKKVTLELENPDRATPREASEVRVLSTIAGGVEIVGSNHVDTADKVIIPRGGNTNGLSGTLAAGAVFGLGYAGPIAHNNLETLILDLGSGSDTLTVTDTGASSTVVSGRGGIDTVRIDIQDPETVAEPAFDGLTFSVETLVLEHSVAGSAAWRVENGHVWVDRSGDSVRIVHVDGADGVRFEGHADGLDTLTIVEAGAESRTVVLEEDRVLVQTGGRILSFNTLSFESSPDEEIAAGTTLMSDIVVSDFPDGVTVEDVEVTVDIQRGGDLTNEELRNLIGNGLTLELSLEGDGTSGFLKPLVVDQDGHSIVVTRFSAFYGQNANGTWKLTLQNETGQSIGTLSGWTLKVTDNGQDYLDDPSAAFSPVVSQDGEYVYCVGPLESGDNAVRVFQRDTANGHLSLAPEESYLGWGFGCSVAISGNTAIAGAPVYHPDGIVARVFVRDNSGTWDPGQELQTDDGVSSSDFGCSVAICGDTAVVGAAQRGSPGSAYVFERDGTTGVWEQVQVLNTGQGMSSDFFGCSVAVSDGTIIVGAAQDNGLGSAYVYMRGDLGDWEQNQVLVANSGADADDFGCSVAISGNTVIVAETEGNSAYIFGRDDSGGLWSPRQVLDVDYHAEMVYFHGSVAISGDNAVVGAYNAAYIFERDNAGLWTQKLEITPEGGWGFSGAYSDFHGFVAVSDQTVLVGAPGENSAYVFERISTSGQWTQQQKLTGGGMEFAHSVALSGGTAVVGAPAHYSEVYAYQIPVGVGATSIAVSPDDQYLYVARPWANNTLSVYRRGAGSLDLYPVQTVAALNDLGNNPSVSISPDGEYVYVTAFGEMVLKYDRDTATGELSLVPTNEVGSYGSQRIVFDAAGEHAYVATDGFFDEVGQLEVFQRDVATGNLTSMAPLQIFRDGINGVDGMARPVALAFSPDQQYLYVAGHDDNAIAVFSRDSGGGLTYVGTVRNGRDGIRGLRGVTSLVVTEEHVFAASEDDDALVAFERGEDGLLTFLQLFGNGRDGIVGLENPNSLAVSPDGTWLYVTSSGVDEDHPGGLAWFGIQQDALPAAPLVVSYSAMQGLIIQTGSGNDRVQLRGTIRGAGGLTVGTGGGDDVVRIQRTMPDATTTIRLGDGDDDLDLIGTGQRAVTRIYGEAGDDTISVWSTGIDSVTEIKGGAGDDTIRIAGNALEAPVDVDGDDTLPLPLGPLGVTEDMLARFGIIEEFASESSGDTLLFGGSGDVAGGLITVGGVEKVRFSNFPADPVFLTDLPQADAGNPSSLQEGGSLALDASASNPHGDAWLAIEWDVDGDGQFGDLIGLGPHALSWSDLVSFGLDDDGEYLVAVRVETSKGYDVDTATVTITNVAPTVEVSGGADPVDQFTLYVLQLSATDPGDDTISLWEINWGDGIVETFPGGSQFATHTYTYDETPGATNQYTIAARAADEDLGAGQWYVATGAPTVVVEKRDLLSGEETAGEGAAYELVLNGSPSFGNPTWTIDWGDGSTPDSFQGLSTTLAHLFLDDSGSGSFQICATIQTDESFLTVTKDVTVANVDPVLKVAGKHAVKESDPYTLYLLAEDPGDDTISSWTIDWDDGTAPMTVAGGSKTISHRYADDGDYSIVVTARDEDCSDGEAYTAGRVAWLDRTVFRFNAGRGNTDHFYTLTAQAGTWNQAAAEAAQLGGYLATITTGYSEEYPDDGQEQAFLDDNFFAVDAPPARLWINGFTRDDGKIVWDTGEISEYENWTEGTPEDGLVAMVRQSAQASGQPLSRWAVTSGDEVMYGIVELESIDKLVAWSSGTALLVTVANEVPQVTLDGPDVVDEGSLFTLTIGVPRDSGSDKVTQYRIVWGDGSEVETVNAPETEAPETDGVFAYEATVSHVYGDNGDYPITLQLVDEDGTYDNDVGLTAHVVNVAPVTTVRGASHVDEGATYRLTLDAAFDPGDDSVSQYQVTWGDGWMQSVTSPGEIAHVYHGQGVHEIAVTLADEDGMYPQVATMAITVGDVPPTIALGGADEVDVDVPYTLHLGEITDPGEVAGGSVDIVLYTVHWGDGSTNEYPADGDVTHIYRDGDFTYTITVDLADANQTYLGAGTKNIKVNEVAPEMADLGTIDFLRLEDLDLSSVRLYYRLVATRAGLFSAETITSALPDSARLRLYDQNPLAEAGLAPLIESSLEGQYQRLDSPVSVGTTYYLAVFGTNSEFAVRMANLVVPIATAVTVHGTDDADSFQFAATGSYTVTINGVEYHFDDAVYETIVFNGGLGDDSAALTGGAGPEVARFYPDHGTFGENGFLVTVSDTTAITAHSGGEGDLAFMYDSPGDDEFVARKGYGKLSGDGFSLETFDFMVTYGYATTKNGGNDVAYMEDTPGADKFKFDWPNSKQFFGKMYGGGEYFNRAKDFERIVATMTDGKDTVRLFDSERNDTFFGQKAESRMTGPGYDVTVSGYDSLIAYASKGTDIAHLEDSADDDTARARPHKIILWGGDTTKPTYEITARKFDEYHFEAKNGGFDKAKFHDTIFDDYVHASGNSASMYGNTGELDLLYEAVAFEWVRLYATGNDSQHTLEKEDPLEFELIFDPLVWDLL